MEGSEAAKTFCNCSHEAPKYGWEGPECTDVCPGVSPVSVCSATPDLSQELGSISESPVLEAAHEVTTICVMLLTCYGVAY